MTLPNKADARLLAAVTAVLVAHASGLTIAHGKSSAFHDQFWIDPNTAKGFATGTSLNGLGKRYALVDRLQQSDTADIVSALQTGQFL